MKTRDALLALVLTFGPVAAANSNGNVEPLNNDPKTEMVDDTLEHYTSAIAGDENTLGDHTDQSRSLGMMVYGPVGSGQALEDKANELFNTYKPHVSDMIVVFKESDRVGEILVGVMYDGKTRSGAYKVDQMINGYEKVLATYGIEPVVTTASIAGLGDRSP